MNNIIAVYPFSTIIITTVSYRNSHKLSPQHLSIEKIIEISSERKNESSLNILFILV